ncbi:hypothetical protein [Leyella stercorea]|uniref:hypothetical protein n=1 Tax=Leyella stercorea TaxID=363265 RepID=UPI003AACF486
MIKHVPHRPTQTSASTDADIRTDRRRHPHRPAQTSAPTDADIRIDRRRHPHRPTQTSAPTDADASSCNVLLSKLIAIL